jgi:uncharacterized protein YndB with AHSA1/START domain
MTPVEAKTGMLIRRPVAEVFEAFINPEITTQFWFTRSSGRLEAGKQIQWIWEMYGASAQVIVKAIEANRRILIEWPGDSTVEWVFEPRAADETFVTITDAGFRGSDEEIVQHALDATEAFALVLCGLKGLLEHNIRLNLVSDRFPDLVKT